jgi:GT2 family glycosyltransferase
MIAESRENMGFAKANNIGIRTSQGKYVCLINSDVVVLEGCFRILHDYMEHHPAVGMVGPRMIGPAHEARRSTMSFPSFNNNLSRAFALDSIFPKSRLFGQYLMAFREFSAVREVDVLSGFFWMIRKQALEQVGLLDERFFIYGEDIDLCKRFAQARWLRTYHPGAAATHFGGMSSAHQPMRFFIEMQKANLQYWRKHHGLSGAIKYRWILFLHYVLRLLGYSLKYLLSTEPNTDVRYKIRRSREALRWLFGNSWA